MCATARVSVCVCHFICPLFLHAAPWVSVLVCGVGDALPPAALTLAEGSYFDADDARQMGLLLPVREHVHVHGTV